MNCPRENKQETVLLDFSAQRLEPAHAAKVAEHLQMCPACSGFVRQQRAVWEALDAWDAPAIGPDFDRRLFQRIEQSSGWRDRWLVPFRMALVRQGLPIAAAACLCVAAGLVSMRAPAPPSRPPAAEVENLQPEQVEHALDDLQMLSDFTRATRAGADEL